MEKTVKQKNNKYLNERYSVNLPSRIDSVRDLVNAILRMRKITQDQLAEELGVASANISRWKNNEYLPRVNQFHAMAKMVDPGYVPPAPEGEPTSDKLRIPIYSRFDIDNAEKLGEIEFPFWLIGSRNCFIVRDKGNYLVVRPGKPLPGDIVLAEVDAMFQIDSLENIKARSHLKVLGSVILTIKP